MIAGIGTDIVKVQRMRGAVARHGDRFLAKVFTPAEIAYCRERVRESEHLAARFAAKEAVAKALGTGVSDGVTLREIEVVNDAYGKPQIALHAGAQRLAAKRNIARLHLSISHTGELAMAQVVAETGAD